MGNHDAGNSVLLNTEYIPDFADVAKHQRPITKAVCDAQKIKAEEEEEEEKRKSIAAAIDKSPPDFAKYFSSII